MPRPPGRRASTSTCRSCAGRCRKQVWTFAKALAQELAGRHPTLMTSEYKVAKRPKGRVLVDYNQNAWGRTLASVYSVRPHAVCRRVNAGDLEGNRQGLPHRGLPARQRAQAVREDRRSVQAASPQDAPRQLVEVPGVIRTGTLTLLFQEGAPCKRIPRRLGRGALRPHP